MGRPKTIHIDRRQLLLGIRREFNREQERLELLAATATNTWPAAQLSDLKAVGVASSVDRFLDGQPLTDSARLAAQREVLDCARAGLVAVWGAGRGRRVLLTPEGHTWLASQATEAAAGDG